MKEYRIYILAFVLSILLVLFVGCATPYGIEKRHERKIAKIKVDSIRASRTTVERRDVSVWTPHTQWAGVNSWYWNGGGFYRPQIVIPIRINKKRNNGNTTNNNSRGGRNRVRGSVPVRVPKVQKPVQPRTLPVRPSKGIIKNKH